jgi:hypothetical protein
MNRAVVANLGWVTVLMGLWLPTAYAQRGMGDAEGLARRGLQPELTKVSGKLVRIETHPCQQTTGQGILGTHVGLLTPEGSTLDIDLGWAAAVESIAARLVIGQPLDAVVFRTDSMPEGRWVAKSLTIDGDVLALRDDRLRPFWAGPGRGQGPSRTAAGSGWGTRGYRRWRRLPCWRRAAATRASVTAQATVTARDGDGGEARAEWRTPAAGRVTANASCYRHRAIVPAA